MIAVRCLLLCSLLTLTPARAWAAPQQPLAARTVAVEEHLGTALPRGLSFTSAQGERVQLAQLLGRGIPVLLVLAYARCSMLCSWVLQGVSDALPRLQPWTPGRDYLPVLVSIDARETPEQARGKQAALLERIGHPGETQRLPYLLGTADQVQALADALGFRFAWDARSEQYAHPSVLFVITPGGVISRYLYGVRFPVRELAEALQGAGRGAIGDASTGASEASALLRCFRFEPGAHRYATQIQRYFQVGGLVLLVALFGLVGGLARWEAKREAQRVAAHTAAHANAAASQTSKRADPRPSRIWRGRA